MELEEELTSAPSTSVLARCTDAREWLLENLAVVFQLTSGQTCPRESKHDVIDLDVPYTEEKNKSSFLPSLFSKKKGSSAKL